MDTPTLYTLLLWTLSYCGHSTTIDTLLLRPLPLWTHFYRGLLPTVDTLPMWTLSLLWTPFHCVDTPLLLKFRHYTAVYTFLLCTLSYCGHSHTVDRLSYCGYTLTVAIVVTSVNNFIMNTYLLWTLKLSILSYYICFRSFDTVSMDTLLLWTISHCVHSPTVDTLLLCNSS